MRRTATIVLIVLLGTLAQAASAQIERYPYGCVEDLALRRGGWEEGDPNPLRCTISNFSFAQFASQADFSGTQFDSQADFREAQFASRAYFRYAQFDSLADFSGAQFDNQADFSRAQFDSRADFRLSRPTR